MYGDYRVLCREMAVEVKTPWVTLPGELIPERLFGFEAWSEAVAACIGDKVYEDCEAVEGGRRRGPRGLGPGRLPAVRFRQERRRSWCSGGVSASMAP